LIFDLREYFKSIKVRAGIRTYYISFLVINR